ncbi:hypothetical protein HHK36_001041 [Tetracentron sinense]|uniref:TPX2 central domain-containing protein n=1 Tax=Tetracentron sinense TaxID=13715 RepID=A0A834ZWY2_TETSI|nr:hypothetical protein HHK36_001041 [Tetracentron sinense]
MIISAGAGIVPSTMDSMSVLYRIGKSWLFQTVIVKLNLREDILVENVNTSPKSKDVEKTDSITNDSNIDMGPEFSTTDENNRDHEGMDGGVFINLPIGYLQKDENESQALGTGLTFYNHMAQDIPKAKSKTAMKARGSTLMKPTASQLAKQNRPREDLYSGQYLERFQKPLVQNKERSVENPSGIESQAAKRQKLEGGHLRKVTDLKQQTNLVHKVPKKSEPVYGNSHAKLKLTIPREPELETAYRAQMARHKNNTELGQHVKSTASTFKAHPLNRKIFEAPSLPLSQKSRPQFPEFQVFHLKKLERATQHSTAASSSPLYCNNSDKVFHLKKLERATQHSTAASSSPLYCNNSDKVFHLKKLERATQHSTAASSSPLYCNNSDKIFVQMIIVAYFGNTPVLFRPNFIDAPKQEGCEIMQRFKARPLNKKIFSSKGDIGVFRNIKREVTVPMEFNFPTDKRFQPNPPIELFTKVEYKFRSVLTFSFYTLQIDACGQRKTAEVQRKGVSVWERLGDH